MSKSPKSAGRNPAGDRPPERERALTGIVGLDEILGGGLPIHQLYVVQGDPGVGKTTFGLQFMLEGARAGEKVLYLSMSESEKEIRAIARSHNWSLDGIHIHHHSASLSFDGAEQQTMLHPSEVELPETTEALLKIIDAISPDRVVVDSLSELRLLARDARWYRRQILAFKEYFVGRNCTAVLLDDRPKRQFELHVESIASGVIQLERVTPIFGRARRRAVIVKMRGLPFDDGYHDLKLCTGGIEIYPRLIAAEHRHRFKPELLSSGLPELDQMLGGGIDRGTSTLITGPAGVGKSSLAMQFASSAIDRGERCLIYAFDERLQTLAQRCLGFGFDLERACADGMVDLRQVDAGELTPGEFSHQVRKAIHEDEVKLVLLDSLNGYLHSMADERFLDLHLHELVAYLSAFAVTSVLVHAQHGLIGAQLSSVIDVSYLADTSLLLRYFEFRGEVRQALSVHKRRGGAHERVIREMRLTSQGVSLGKPLQQFQGVLTGVPVFAGDELRETRE